MVASGERASICTCLPSGNPATPTGIANINSTVTTPFTLRVIPRDQHTISRKDISPNALRVLYRLRDAGFTHQDLWFQCFNFGSMIAIKSSDAQP